MQPQQTKTTEPPNERPPIFRTWSQMYVFVLVLHAVLILLFYLFTKYYS